MGTIKDGNTDNSSCQLAVNLVCVSLSELVVAELNRELAPFEALLNISEKPFRV